MLFKYINKFEILLYILCGISSHILLKPIMLISNKGIEYYGEAHTTTLNCYIHTIFMPISMIGIILFIMCFFCQI